MSEPRDPAGVLQDLSVLYELSLNVGRTLDLNENCDRFLTTLMARKDLDFASVWIRNRYRAESEDDPDAFSQVYANPAFRAPLRRLPADHPLPARLKDEPAFSVSSGQPGFQDAVTETGIDCGAYSVHALGKLGFLKLHSTRRNGAFDRTELSKLRNVLDKFTVSIEGCLDHALVRTAEARRIELELQMLHTQKLESLGVLAGGIAHDFNNLLTVILGNAEIAQIDAREGRDVHQHVEHVIESALRAADLCSQLLAYSGRGHFVTGPVDLNEVVDDMVRLKSVTISKKADLEVDRGSDLPAVEGDVTQVRQVVMNLITNASEALGEGSGRLLVRTGETTVSSADLQDYQLGLQREPGRYAYLLVEDTGCGMPSTTQQKMFDPFFTTKFTGRGLGLAAVLGIVRSHGGAIRVRSAPQEGTSVQVLFPFSGELAPPKRVEGPANDERSGGETILIADDEGYVRDLLTRIAEDLGLKVLIARDGGEALDVFRARGDEVDLALLDLTMPVLGGDEVLEHIAMQSPRTPVVLTSGFSRHEAAARFSGDGPAAFLKKPFRLEEAREVLCSVLDRARSARSD